MNRPLFVWPLIILALVIVVVAFIFADARDSHNIQESRTEKTLELIKGQVGIVFADVVFDEDSKNSLSSPESPRGLFMGSGFFVDPTTVVLTKHQYEFDGHADSLKDRFFYIALPSRGEIYSLDIVSVSSSKDLVLMKAHKEEWDHARKLPDLLTFSMYAGELRAGSEVRTISMKAYMPFQRKGLIATRDEIARLDLGQEPPLSVILLDRSQIVNGDSGSPVFTMEDNKVYLLGVVTEASTVHPKVAIQERILVSDVPAK